MDFDNWAQLLNDSSWTYSSLLPYFKKSENYMGVYPKTNQHGRRGPVAVETNTNRLESTWKEAAKELGYEIIDPNGPQRNGFSYSDITRRDGRRVSTFTAYIQPILMRKTLKVVPYAEVQRILISRRVAHGVQYLRHGQRFIAHASKEIILCAGAINTPLLLFESGIGPSKMLREAGIKPILNLRAVGKYLQDQPGPFLTPLFLNPYYVESPSNLTATEFEKFLNHEKGSILSRAQIILQAYFSSTDEHNQNWPDLHIRGRYFCNFYSFANETCFDVVVGRPKFTPKSYGTVKLNTSAYQAGERDSVKLLLIDDKLLKTQRIKKMLREGIKFYQKIVKTEAFKRIGAVESFDATCGKLYNHNSAKYWDCFISNAAIVHDHSVGTCRMGKLGDRLNSVVDSKLRVHGVKRLRIVDASVMPQITNANTHAPVMAIAEKAAEIITHNFNGKSKSARGF